MKILGYILVALPTLGLPLGAAYSLGGMDLFWLTIQVISLSVLSVVSFVAGMYLINK